MYRIQKPTSIHVKSKLVHFACQPVPLAFPRVSHQEFLTKSVARECLTMRIEQWLVA